MIGIENQQFGVEIEFTGITRREAAKALADYFQTSPVYVGAGYDTWAVEDSQGRQWKIMSDSSIRSKPYKSTKTASSSGAKRCGSRC